MRLLILLINIKKDKKYLKEGKLFSDWLKSNWLKLTLEKK